MSNYQEMTFDQRVGQIVRRHKSLRKGAVACVGSDGLMTVRPQRTSLRFPWRGLAIAMLVMLVWKAGLYAYLGADIYAERLVSLHVGSGVDKFGAWLMAPDAATKLLASYIAPWL